MAKLFKTNGEILDVKPNDGDSFSLKELQSFVGGYIEIVKLPANKLLVVNEEGYLLHLPVNVKVSSMFKSLFLGDCLICDSRQIN